MLLHLGLLFSRVIRLMPSKPALLDQSSVSLSFHTSHAKLLLFDWDGTLTPIVKRPADAVPTPAIVRILEHLSSQSLTAFWVISGRDQTFLNHHFGSIQSLGLSAEHGAFVRRPHATAWEDISGSIGTAWQSVIMSIFEEFTSKTPGSWIERKNIAITWHYRSATPDQGALHSAECKQRLLDQISQSLINLEVINGKMCLEVRLRSVNKGTIVRRIVQDYGRSHGLATSPDWVLCVGDDVTDEGATLPLNFLYAS